MHKRDLLTCTHPHKVEFLRAFDGLQLEPPLSKADLMLLFSYIDADGGGTIELDDIEIVFQMQNSSEQRDRAFDQKQA